MRIEKRTSLRLPLSIHVAYWVHQQERQEVYQVESVNIGAGGIFIRTELPLGIGTEVHLEFTLPGSREPIRIQGKVVWSGGISTKGADKIQGKGIEFTACDDRIRKQLLDYIEANKTDIETE
ncbi:MAG: hypothetical protein GXP58_10670 [Deltaproteobacteria bacterium]|nr:hypothetical protein [Deltaproteobacteria bacterium]